MPAAAIAMGALLVVIGGVAAYFSLRTPPATQRAVAGSPGAAAPAAGAPAAAGSLPTGHPSIELPKEVLEFLDSLAAEADKEPQSIDAVQKLARARYRASVINASYRAAAQQALTKLLALDPTNEEGLRISANLAYDAGDFPEAQKRFEAFLVRHPDDASAITDLGSALLFQDRLDDAIKNYETAVAKNPKFMQARFNLGIALQKKGNKNGAVSSLRSALDLASTPEEKQHIENALAEVEGREPMQIAGAGASASGATPAGSGVTPTASGVTPSGSGATPGATPQAPAAQGSMQGGMPMPPPAPDRDVATNASSDFQRKAEKPFITHPIVGPRMAAFEWTGASSVRAKVADFPMEQMPPFARAKFKSSMAEKLAGVAKQGGVTTAVTAEIVDSASGRVMETIDSSAAAPAPAAPPVAPPVLPAAPATAPTPATKDAPR